MTLTYLTADTPGIGGSIKQRPEDFLVQELPLYEPSGRGEHLYLLVEKKNQTTMDILRILARAAGVPPRAIGYAGLKDKHAITRQHFSIHLPDTSRDADILAKLEDTPAKVLWGDRHGNKLRRGHHAGNRFDIRIRQVQMTDVLPARKMLNQLAAQGVPNYFGAQRFGFDAINDQLGRLLIQGQWQALVDLALGEHEQETSESLKQARMCYQAGDYDGALASIPPSLRHDRQMLTALKQGRDARSAVMALDHQHRDLLVSAWQSAIFNHVLSQRVAMGTFGQLVAGDLAWKHDSRAVFAVNEATAALENAPDGRAARMLVSPSGPMWGKQMTRPTGQVLAWELEALAQGGLSEADLSSSALTDVPGERRPMRLLLSDPEIRAGGDEHGPYIQLSFGLERGGFATVVLDEIIKPDRGRPLENQAADRTSPSGDQAS
jgi:tRNA pseudouridine13 synthase